MLSLKELTIEQKIGRVLCTRCPEKPDDWAFTLELVEKEALGCVQMRVDGLAAERIRTLRRIARYPLLIMNDMEQGYSPARPAVSLLALSAGATPEEIRTYAATIAHDALADGFTGCWGPVVDLLHADAAAAVSRRAGDTPERVLAVAREIAAVFHKIGFMTTAKHYPGGKPDYPMDTHMVEGTCSISEQELREVDLVPYLSLFREGLLPAIMTDHTRYPNIDPDYPASLSKKVIGILRNEGYDGLIFTDSLAMMGILQRYGEAGAMALALEAGNDIILPNYRTPLREAYRMMLDAYREGKISDARLDDAVRHVMEAEVAFAHPTPEAYPLPENANETLEAIAKNAVTFRAKEGLSPCLATDEEALFIVMTPQKYEAGKPLSPEISFGRFYDPHRVIAAIEARYPRAKIVTLPEFPSPGDNDRVLTEATHYRRVVFCSYCYAAAYLGTDSLCRRVEAVINSLSLSGKLFALVHFGNPLATEVLLPPDRILYGYSLSASQINAFSILAGEYPPRGVFPFPSLVKPL